MAAEIAIGDIVGLKSGGPDMTVIAIEDDSIRCTWFDGSRPPHEKTFPREALQPIRAKSKIDISGLSPEERETLAQLVLRTMPKTDTEP